MADGFSNVVLGTANGRVHGQTTCHESRNSSREGAARTMGVGRRDTPCAQLNKAFSIEVHIYRISSTMASLHHNMTGTQRVNGLCRRAHIVQRLDSLSGQHFRLV